MAEEQLEGQIHSVIYGNEETGWSVLRVAAEDGSLSTAVGYIPFPVPGETLTAGGRWTVHPSHGSQFLVESIDRRLPATAGAILEYLSSGIVQGVGRATARSIVDAFGDQTLTVLELSPQKLAEVKGITPRRAEQIGRAYAGQTLLRRLMEFLAARGIVPSVALTLTRDYGPDAFKRLMENPYILAREQYGVDFEKADSLALNEGFEPDDVRRIEAGLIFELVYNLEQGHTYLPYEKLVTATAQMLDLPREPLETALDGLLEHGRLSRGPGGECYLTHILEAEENVAAFVRGVSGGDFFVPDDIEKVISRIESELGISYAPAQREAVRLAAAGGLMVLTGGPGTGKTTTVCGILRLFDYMGLKVSLAAPTGRAAKRMSELVGREASTIHRLLEFGFDPEGGAMRFLRDEENPLAADAVVLDEVSMIDILLMDSMVRALKGGARLILVGDPDQLPAVGPGAVLEDIIQSGRVASVRLTEIFRQARESRIVVNAHDVNRGVMPPLKNDGGDFFFMRRRDMMAAVDTIGELCAVRLPQNLKVDPAQIQVLTPTRRGPCGTVSLNKILQNALNPPAAHKLEKQFGEFIYREGDRVMQIRNNYELVWRQETGMGAGMGVFNGEIGTIAELDLKASHLTVRYDDRLVVYGFDILSELEPAYALTVHKAQGSEYDAVVLAAMPGPRPLMTRRVLYTAITRAKKWLIIVGDDSVVGLMVSNDRRSRRYSGLKAQLNEKEEV